MTLTADRGKLLEVEAVLKAAREMRRERKMSFYAPYPKQKEFHALGAKCSERLLMAGNQLGKTWAGAFESACHLTGIYPEWWTGRRWDRPVRFAFGGETAVLVRDVSQRHLCGTPGVLADFGTGMIPKDHLIDKTLGRGVTDAFDTIMVRHISGGTSIGLFKTYEQGREKWQADTLDGIWDDEETPSDVYGEQLARISATAGMIYVTFTPLKGRSEVVNRFLDEPSTDRAVVTMTIDDVTHISPEEKKKIILRYKAHERDARVRGIPMLGSGAIFQAAESEMVCDPFRVPDFWPQLWGVDFGIGHPFAAARLAWDRDTDIIYITHCFKMTDEHAPTHVAAIKAAGEWIHVAWPQDGTQRDKGSGSPLASIYRTLGARMLPTHATFPDGSISTEAGVAEINDREASGRFKVFNTCGQYLDERRRYHRKDGQIVKEFDDILSATRVAVMAKRYARAQISTRRAGQGVQIADGLDFNLFA